MPGIAGGRARRKPTSFRGSTSSVACGSKNTYIASVRPCRQTPWNPAEYSRSASEYTAVAILSTQLYEVHTGVNYTASHKSHATVTFQRGFQAVDLTCRARGAIRASAGKSGEKALPDVHSRNTTHAKTNPAAWYREFRSSCLSPGKTATRSGSVPVACLVLLSAPSSAPMSTPQPDLPHVIIYIFASPFLRGAAEEGTRVDMIELCAGRTCT